MTRPARRHPSLCVCACFCSQDRVGPEVQLLPLTVTQCVCVCVCVSECGWNGYTMSFMVSGFVPELYTPTPLNGQINATTTTQQQIDCTRATTEQLDHCRISAPVLSPTRDNNRRCGAPCWTLGAPTASRCVPPDIDARYNRICVPCSL